MATREKKTKTGSLKIADIDYEKYKRDLQSHQTAKDLMSQNVLTTTPEASLEDTARTMGENHIGSLIVEKYKTPIGIVTERDLLSKVLGLGLFLKDEKVEDIMSYPLTGISPTTKIKEAAQLMINKKTRLAVYEAGTLVGIITASDLIKSLPDVPETEVKVDDLMTKDVVTADEQNTVLAIARTMGRERIGSVLIIREGEPFGIFTERDLLTSFLATGRTLFTEVGLECSTPITAITAETSVHRAAATMATNHVRRLPIIRDNNIIGIITARDLVEAYAK